MDNWISVALLGTLLTIMTGLMVWQALAIISAGKSIIVLETILSDISEELKKYGHHDTAIAVIHNKINNLEADYSLLFEKIRDLERDDKGALRR